jgi:hypothetical protein
VEEERRNLLKREEELEVRRAITRPEAGSTASTCSGVRKSSY